VKNFAQMVEISNGVDKEEEVARLLYSLGVEQIRGDVH
jgi:DNA-directed RNA polymerase subunit B"